MAPSLFPASQGSGQPGFRAGPQNRNHRGPFRGSGSFKKASLLTKMLRTPVDSAHSLYSSTKHELVNNNVGHLKEKGYTGTLENRQIFKNVKHIARASLVAQWLRIHLNQCMVHGFETWSRRIPHAAEQLSPCATATEAACHNYWARALQWEKPPQWEACAPQRRVAPARCN